MIIYTPRNISSILPDYRSHLVKLLFHISDKFELGPATIQILIRIMDTEIMILFQIVR